jgi:hypothetical protein
MMICKNCGSTEIQIKTWIWLNGEGESDETTIMAVI